MTIKDLQPQLLWGYFHALTQIPRPSYHEEAVRQYVLDEAARLGLFAEIDEVGNVLVRKPATAGKEYSPGVILQSHLDMVAQKNNDSDHDFQRDPIRTQVDGDWLRAQGTTLGADNGIGAAAALAVLADKNLVHGPIEALFTATEECGMDGAKGLREGWLQGDILLNLDSEEEGELYIGCAGGVDAEITLPLTRENNTQTHAYHLTISGLSGGHSGLNIIDQRGNATIILMRVIDELVEHYEIKLASAEGGNMRNAIPREAEAVLCGEIDESTLQAHIEAINKALRAELPKEDQKLAIGLKKAERPATVLEQSSLQRLIAGVLGCPNGVVRMDLAMSNLVETSSNLAIIRVGEDQASLQALIRSSHEDAKADLARRFSILAAALEGSATFEGDYPGWQPDPEAAIVQTMLKTGEALFGKTPQLKAIHAGLECGILGEHYPDWQMISFGPTITGAHSPDEQVHIPSVVTFWQWLSASLSSIADQDSAA
ncbi:aminoacyl-histidine dipeptidase [Suttonella sp. R2A3]|uniref:aminoacyl-histidine dipeptidase n=1 Tax=Suttonella sp. R2A3 TaxID=2908648 RepID=UPI001F3315E0|nr:aminoacyl-histidine dipeptidase [Suttonella sp. R2A3]UJF24953.1 aminoacyl-histidine dipeptidase [Suttonella sp. R2A3]